MKRFGWLAWSCIFVQLGAAQSLTFRELCALPDLTQSKLENYLHKKGFKHPGFYTSEEQKIYEKVRQEDSSSIIRRFQISFAEKSVDVVYSTTSLKEYSRLQFEIEASDYYRSSSKKLFQKQNTVISCSTGQIDSTVFYTLQINKKSLPKIK